MEALVLALVATGHIRGERVACRPGFAQSKVTLLIILIIILIIILLIHITSGGDIHSR